jgi:hypothetical protein
MKIDKKRLFIAIAVPVVAGLLLTSCGNRADRRMRSEVMSTYGEVRQALLDGDGTAFAALCEPGDYEEEKLAVLFPALKQHFLESMYPDLSDMKSLTVAGGSDRAAVIYEDPRTPPRDMGYYTGTVRVVSFVKIEGAWLTASETQALLLLRSEGDREAVVAEAIRQATTEASQRPGGPEDGERTPTPPEG